MRVVLVSLHSLRSISIPFLDALLRRAGHDVTCVYFKVTTGRPTQKDVDRFVDAVADLDPDVVGFSVMSTFYRTAGRLSDLLRKRTRAKIIWGGIHPTLRPAESLEFADVVCVGEGEGAFIDFLNALENGSDYSAIPNLWVKRDGEIVSNDIRPLIEDLDILPYPDFTGKNKIYIDNGRILTGFENEKVMHSYALTASRGCLHDCAFCCNSFLKRAYRGKGKVVRRRSVDSVIDELVQAKETYENLHDVAVEDDSFMFNDKWLEEFAEKYRENVNLFFFAYSHPNLVTEKRIKLLKSCGLVYTVMGIQSGSERIRTECFNRHTPAEQILEAARIVHDNGVLLCIDLITNIPYETREDRMASLDLITSLPKPHQQEVFTLQFFPETELTKRALDGGTITENDVESVCERGYEIWYESLFLGHDDEHLFWDVLYFLAKKKRLSKKFVIGLAQNRFFEKHIRMITRVLRLLPIDNYGFHQVTINSPLQKVYFGLYQLFRLHWKRSLAIVKRDLKYLLVVLKQRILARKTLSAE